MKSGFEDGRLEEAADDGLDLACLVEGGRIVENLPLIVRIGKRLTFERDSFFPTEPSLFMTTTSSGIRDRKN